MLGRFGFFFIPALVLLSSTVRTQTANHPTLETLISGAAEQRKVYINEFKNLLSQETKANETYDKNGEVKKKRTIISTFIVYQLTRDENSVAEYRNVISVDGKKVDNAEKRAQDFFEEIAKVGSSQKELEKIENEGSRYDGEISLNLFTLYQAVALADNMRPFFEFKLEGFERTDGRDLAIVSYRQTRQSPYVLTEIKRRPPDGKLTLIYDVDYEGETNPRLRGKFWIDAQSSQVWKEHRELTVQPGGFISPVLFAETVFEYQPSAFGILTPKRIAYTQFEIGKKAREPRKDVGVVFSYENFTKPDVQVKSADIKN